MTETKKQASKQTKPNQTNKALGIGPSILLARPAKRLLGGHLASAVCAILLQRLQRARANATRGEGEWGFGWLSPLNVLLILPVNVPLLAAVVLAALVVAAVCLGDGIWERVRGCRGHGGRRRGLGCRAQRRDGRQLRGAGFLQLAGGWLDGWQFQLRLVL